MLGVRPHAAVEVMVVTKQWAMVLWVADGPSGLHRYKLRLLFDAVEMRWDWPVDVNYHEAKAYCAWKAAQVKHAGTNALPAAAALEHSLNKQSCTWSHNWPQTPNIT